MRYRIITLFTAALLGPCIAAAAPAPWWTHAVIYEIYPRSFQDTNGDGVGDLKGVTQRLDYLQQLGVDAIWLTPFYPSPNADFGYDVADYTNVAPEYGTMADWDTLVREARRRGLRVLVDLVLNHSSDQHPWFQESRSSLDNPKRDWYVWRNGSAAEAPTNWESIFGGSAWSYERARGQWYYHIFLPQQPDFNWASPGLRAAMFKVVRFWLDHGASGFRLDATPYLFEDPTWPQDPDPKSGAPVWLKPYNSGRPETHAVLHELRSILDRYPGERVLLGESATASIEELAATYGPQHDEINLPMDFLFGNLTQLDARAFKRQVDDAELKLNGQPPVFFFSSHDHARQWSSFGDGRHNEDIAKLTAALTLTPRGTALLYYGEEIGMGNLPDSQLAGAPLGVHRPRADERDRARSPMQWSGAANAGFSAAAPWLPVAATAQLYNVERERGDPHSVYAWYAQLLHLRRSNPALREGDYEPLQSGNPQVFAFERTSRDGHAVLVVFNASAENQVAHLTGWPGSEPTLDHVLLANPAPTSGTVGDLQIAPFGVSILALQAASTAPRAATLEYRPHYHFSPASHWINDPNGLVWVNGTYHLFYQYNPFGERWGHMSWGHATSADLAHWQELPVALPEDPAYMIFSGSIVADTGNSSGLGHAGQAPLVAIYTGSQRSAAEIQNQQIAFSNDAAMTWTKYAGNPVLDLKLHAFRDPKVFWHEPTRQWIMVAVLADARKVTFYASSDLKTWRHLSDFGPAGGIDGAWECPDLFALPVQNSSDVRWVLKVDVFKSATVAGSGAQYFVGSFDGRGFNEDPKGSGRAVDYGRDFYAAASWSNLPASDGRHLWVAWMNNHRYAQDIPTSPWRGAMSLPREVSLRASSEGYELLQAPAVELRALRRLHRQQDDVTLNAARGPRTLLTHLNPAAEIIATLEPHDAREVGLAVRVGAHQETVIGYDVASQRLFLDRSHAGRSDFNPDFAARHWAPLVLKGPLRVHVFLDRSSVEVFAQDGERVFTEQIFPAAESLALRAYSSGGSAVLRHVDIWDLAPAK